MSSLLESQNSFYSATLKFLVNEFIRVLSAQYSAEDHWDISHFPPQEMILGLFKILDKGYHYFC